MQTRFTPLQLELLKIYSFNLPEKELLEIKDLLGKHFLNKLSLIATASAKEKGYTQKDYDSWLNEPGQ